MSEITLVFAADLEDHTSPQAFDRDTAEPEEEVLTKKWPLEDSMYIVVFKDAVKTVLEHERFLFSDSEITYLNWLHSLPVEALYILIRLSLRKDRWYRKLDYEHYANAMEDNSLLDSAITALLARQDTPPSPKRTEAIGSDRDAPIDLTSDSDEEEIVDEVLGVPTPNIDADLAYHASSHEEATLNDLLDMLTLDELTKLGKSYNVKTSGKKRKELAEAVLKSANSQQTLSFFRPPPLQQSNRNVSLKSKSGGRLREICLKALGQCIRLNPKVLLLIRRISLVFFRTTSYEAQLFVPAILVACKKRKYSLYEATRSSHVFTSREDLLSYEAALTLESATEDVMEKLQGSAGRKKEDWAKEREALENKLVILFNEIILAFNACIEENRKEERGGLERFESGYVYVRTLYHIAFQVGKIRGLDVEMNVLNNLAKQDRWLLGKRGACYERLACIYMKELKNRETAEKAHNVVTQALLDPETRIRYRPKLVRRLTRIEKALDIPLEERHKCEAVISKCDEIYILGERLDDITTASITQVTLPDMLATSPGKKPSPKPMQRRSSGKTLWKGENEESVGVEEFALEYYARKGFKGKHCEGRITRFLFALLFHDILFHPSVPGVFETVYQTAPLDLVHDTFYSARKELVDKRLEEILIPGEALKIDGVFFVGGRWDTFEREELLEIVQFMPESVIHIICQLQAMDFEGSAGGVLDLILWSVDKEEVKFVEVKSPNDKLSETQKLWIHHLVNAGATVEVCHVETAADRQKRKEKLDIKRERSKSRSRSKSVASTRKRGKSMAESEEEEEDDDDDERSDYEVLDVDNVKMEDEEDLGPSRGTKRGIPDEGSGESSQRGQRNKRVKTESD
ncbi:hypothetical protein M408DRAFT_28886 [Serendipita vermifera MAFF 305830]|uniref:Fanconi-associated nuclease n=1 Tax=Serendipita vermifera MAFF 305830 TaxID=933852 RepID=A0A0C2WY58_SERVB|nr:hypothetical protein M408DRAFT_28886 [Serendipita vermifera MAFF 305830]